eukprot:TRINITY_DN20815_c0_g1_i1.p1 TRINITY_DN20815_c0_g1~~TRINITY_DN20815_c0_g1_i1.p1  ORF type:complete len:697 (-),score=74.80 TRINITY_DN20815_c0_g1_i1:87-1868(-)
MALLFTYFLALHVHAINIFASEANPREAHIKMTYDPKFAVYYILFMAYVVACVFEQKYGLPAVASDVLRPAFSLTDDTVIYEKVRYFAFALHGLLPFVDELRVIIDWTVVPTSLDLWMYFKVEDAHDMFYRTRHLMYVRRQSFFAEERDWLEKIYSGWVLILIIVVLILAPIVIFSPISPFPMSVLISAANLNLKMHVATACTVADPGSNNISCRSVETTLFTSPALQIFPYNQSRTEAYLQDNTQVNTDIDIEEVRWPWYSQETLEVSPAAGTQMAAFLNGVWNGGPAAMAIFQLEIGLDREAQGRIVRTTTECLCAPAAKCFALREKSSWPPRIIEMCRDKLAYVASFDSEQRLNETMAWWSGVESTDATASRAYHSMELRSLWSSSLRVNTKGLRALNSPSDMSFGAVPRYIGCQRGAKNVTALTGINHPWCAEGLRWGSLYEQVTNGSNTTLRGVQATVELERSANLGTLAQDSSYGSAIGLYLAVVLVAGRYLRGAFEDSSKRAVYEELPNVEVFLDLVAAIKLAREHKDLKTEFQLYYCLMKVLRSTQILMVAGGTEPFDYGVGRTDPCPKECVETSQNSKGNTFRL